MGLLNAEANKSLSRGFSLVELVVVISIVGILASISVPLLNVLAKKARQREAIIIVSSVLRVVKMHIVEHSEPPRDIGDLSQYIEIIECRIGDRRWCKENTSLRNMGMSQANSQTWNSPSGLYTISFSQSNSSAFVITARPQSSPPGSPWRFLGDEYGASGCFNYASGISKLFIASVPGASSVRSPRC